MNLDLYYNHGPHSPQNKKTTFLLNNDIILLVKNIIKHLTYSIKSIKPHPYKTNQPPKNMMQNNITSMVLFID